MRSESGPKWRIGPAGWSYRDWEGVVYPRPKPRDFHRISYLGRYFDTIEINSSFYAHPQPAHARRWRLLVEDLESFRFTAKLGSCFTHAEPADDLTFARERELYLSGIQPIADRLGAVLVQFPITFRDSPPARHRIDRIREAFGELGLVLELRHRSWFEPGALAFVEAGDCSLAAIDLPPADNHPPADSPTPGPIGYLRLHGRNAAAWFNPEAGRDQRFDYLYRPNELELIAHRARQISKNSDTTFVITNNHFTGKAVANAIEITHLLTDRSLPAPIPLIDHYPHLRAITHPDGQQSLF